VQEVLEVPERIAAVRLQVANAMRIDEEEETSLRAMLGFALTSLPPQRRRCVSCMAVEEFARSKEIVPKTKRHRRTEEGFSVCHTCFSSDDVFGYTTSKKKAKREFILTDKAVLDAETRFIVRERRKSTGRLRLESRIQTFYSRRILKAKAYNLHGGCLDVIHRSMEIERQRRQRRLKTCDYSTAHQADLANPNEDGLPLVVNGLEQHGNRNS